MTNLLLTNARALDTRGGDLSPPSDILIQDGKIADIGAGRPAGEAETIDVGGRVVMPGYAICMCMSRQPPPICPQSGIGRRLM